MDYEKKYNEALERARKVHRNYKNLFPEDSYSEDIEEIFPELRESEDERMIREFNDWLCEEIECRTNDLRDEKDRRTLNMLCYVLTKVKDWLEKQKEQNLGDKIANAMGISSKVCDGEPKPAWSDEDEDYMNAIITIINRETALYPKGGATEDLNNDLIAWLKSRCPNKQD